MRPKGTFLTIFFIVVFVGFLISETPSYILPEKKPLNPQREVSEFKDGALEIKERAERIQGVNKASVLILNRTALIALELDDSIKGANIAETKKRVVVIAGDMHNVDEVLVTADPDIAAEISNIFAGKAPLESLEDIYSRIRQEKKIK